MEFESKKRKFVLSLLLILGLSGELHAYPLYFKCAKNRSVSFDVSDVEIAAIEGKTHYDSNDLAACRKEARQQKALFGPKTSLSVDQIRRLTPQKFFQHMRAINGKKLIKEKDFFHIYYPFHNNYTYVTGCMGASLEKCKVEIMASENDSLLIKSAARTERFVDGIQQALAAGVDPLIPIALSFMETGPSPTEATSIRLDPIGSFAALGCKHSLTKKRPGSFESYSTFYEIPEQVVENEGFVGILEKIALLKGTKLPPRTSPQTVSYYCKSLKKERNAMGSPEALYPEPQKNSCCVEIPYSFETAQNSIPFLIDGTKNAAFLKNEMVKDDRFRGRDPAFTLQKFNGFTDLMGAAEGVTPWRAGTNFFKHPSYGYQAMDFIINSFMTNPVLTHLIEREKKRLKNAGAYEEYSSVLCLDKKPGVHRIETESYFHKVANTPRFSQIYDKFGQEVPFEELSKREKRVLFWEFYGMREQFPEFHRIVERYVNEYQDDDKEEEFKEEEMTEELDNYVQENNLYKLYFDKYYEDRKTLRLSSQASAPFRWDRLTQKEIERIKLNLDLKEKVLPIRPLTPNFFEQ